MLAASASLALAVGCATGPATALLLDVPFYPQRENECGVAAMQMLLSYYRLSDAAGQIREDIYLPALQGAIPEMLVDAAANRGLHARLEHGSIESLARCLQAGTPPIVFLSSSADRQRGHFAVVTGIGEKGRMICLHTGTSPNRWRGSKEFLEAWRQTDFTSIVIAR